jgi:hypothetical protein
MTLFGTNSSEFRYFNEDLNQVCQYIGRCSPLMKSSSEEIEAVGRHKRQEIQ